VTDWLRFHTGAPIIASPAEAMFTLVADAAALPPLAEFAMGTDEYPDRSTTLILGVATLDAGAPLTLRGPGIKDTVSFAPSPLPPGFVAQWADNRAKFPRGVDVIFVAKGQVAGLPRSTRIGEG
jgi:alpha-D-ribose 1-methylphosphonate 5-triphosphate synthase subunit PhnH